MRKTIQLILLLILPASINAQWQATGASSNQFNSIEDVESHNNILFASESGTGLIKSTDNGASWAAANQTGFTTNPISVRVTHILSAGSSLYAVTFNANYASSMIYVSNDDGQTFVPDTAGIPKVTTGNDECVNVDRIYYHNGYLIADVANLGNWIKPVSGDTWVKNNHAGVEWAELFGFYNGKFFCNGGYRNFFSTDNGETWTQCADANLPQWFSATLFHVDPVTGRIYLAGRSVTTNLYNFFYSDNEGASWDSIAIHQYLGTSWLGLQQTVRAIYSNGDYVQIAFENNAANTPPDVLVSVDGGLSFSPDIDGLPDVGQTVAPVSFALQNGELFMALNYVDIYKKSVSLSSISETPGIPERLALSQNYPNPFNPSTRIHFSVAEKSFITLKIFNTLGEEVALLVNEELESGNYEYTWDAEGLTSGIYFYSLTGRNNYVSVKKMILLR